MIIPKQQTSYQRAITGVRDVTWWMDAGEQYSFTAAVLPELFIQKLGYVFQYV